MASSPITSWQIDGGTVETASDFIFLGSKITVNGDYSHEIKRRLLLGRKVMTNLDSILKSRDITLLTKVHLDRAMVFPWASLVAQTVKRLPTMREARVRSLGWEDPLEKEMATHSSILAWGSSPWGRKESDMTEQLN